MRGAADLIVENVSNLGQLLHQVDLGMEPTRCIHDQVVRVEFHRPLRGSVGYRGRVGVRFPRDDLDAEPLAPDGQLLDRGRSKSVGRRQDDRFSC